MKKLLALLLACLMALPLGMICVSADEPAADTAQQNTVYLSDNGSDKNDGLTAAKPKKTLTQSYAALGDEGGEIVIVGTVTHTATFIAPAHTGTVTIKGADANAKYVMKGSFRFFLGGPTVFDNFTLEAKAGTFLLVCLFNDFTATETFSINRTKDVLLVVGGQSDKDYKKNRDFGKAKDTTVTLDGGDWKEVIGGMRQGLTVPESESKTVTKKAADFSDYELTFNIGGNVVISKFFALNRSVTTDIVAPGSSCTINLTGGVITHFAGVNDQKSKSNGYEDGVTVNIYKTFDINESFNGDTTVDSNRYNSSGVFCGISGETLYAEGAIKFERLVNGTLNVEEEVYIDVIGSGKANTETFKQVNNGIPAAPPDNEDQNDGTPADTSELPADTDTPTVGGNPAESGSPDDTSTPSSDNASDTATGNGGGISIGVAIAIVAGVVVVVGAVLIILIKKKK